MAKTSGTTLQNAIGFLGFLSQQAPDEPKGVGGLHESFETSGLHTGEKNTGDGHSHEDATRRRLNTIQEAQSQSKSKLFPLVIGGLSSTADGRGKQWKVEPVLSGGEMKYLAMLMEGDTRTAYAGRQDLWEKITLMNRSFEKKALIDGRARSTANGRPIHSPSSEKVFENLCMLDDAAKGRRCVAFSLCRYGNNGKLKPPKPGASEYRAYRIAPLRLRSANGRFYLDGRFFELKKLAQHDDGSGKLQAEPTGKTYSFLVDMICHLAYCYGEAVTEDAAEALTFSLEDMPNKTEARTVRLRLYARRPGEKVEGAGLSTPMEKLRNQLFTRFDGRALVTTDEAVEEGWETAIATLADVDEYELESWAPYVRGQMHIALEGTELPVRGFGEKSALDLPYAVRMDAPKTQTKEIS